MINYYMIIKGRILPLTVILRGRVRVDTVAEESEGGLYKTDPGVN